MRNEPLTLIETALAGASGILFADCARAVIAALVSVIFGIN